MFLDAHRSVMASRGWGCALLHGAEQIAPPRDDAAAVVVPVASVAVVVVGVGVEELKPRCCPTSERYCQYITTLWEIPPT